MKFRQLSLRVQSKEDHALIITQLIKEKCQFIEEFDQGVLQIFLRHTSASLTINENTDADVRSDLHMALDHMVPESLAYRHTDEGPDDMPSHVKSSLIGTSLSIPISNGKLGLGQWQGIYLWEHRKVSHLREIVCSAWGV